jgi:hypothetical protein
VVQAEEGRLPQATGSGLQVSDPSQAHEREADQVGKQAAQTVREDGGDDPWGLERVPIFDSTGQAIVDHLGQVLPDLSLLDADHRTALESTLSAGRDHVESDGLLDSLAGDLVGSAAPAVSSSGSGLALHREAESGAVSPEASTSSGGLQEADSSQEGVLDSEHQTNTEGVWLVSDPSRYSETIVERLPAGTRLIVLERGEEQPFNQTDSSYQWWLVALVEGGGTGWVMQVLATPVSQSDSQSLGESGDLEEEDLSESSSQEELFDSYEQNFCEQDGPVLTAFDTSVLSSQIETPASPSFSDPQGSGAGIVISLFGQFLSGLVSKVGTSPADYDRRLVQAQASQALQKEIEALNTPEMAAHLLNIYLGSEDEPPQQFVTLGFGIGCIVLQQIGYQEIIEDFQGAVAAVEIASGLGNLDGALLREKTMAVAEPLRLEAEEGWGSKNAYVQYHHQVEEVDLEQIFGDRVQYLESVEQSEMSLEHESDSEQSESETQ